MFQTDIIINVVGGDAFEKPKPTKVNTKEKSIMKQSKLTKIKNFAGKYADVTVDVYNTLTFNIEGRTFEAYQTTKGLFVIRAEAFRGLESQMGVERTQWEINERLHTMIEETLAVVSAEEITEEVVPSFDEEALILPPVEVIIAEVEAEIKAEELANELMAIEGIKEITPIVTFEQIKAIKNVFAGNEEHYKSVMTLIDDKKLEYRMAGDWDNYDILYQVMSKTSTAIAY